MRFIPILLFVGFTLPAFAAQPAQKNLQPLDPPPVMSSDAADEPEVTIVKQTELTVEEYRSNGRLYMIKVTPRIGPPYYLIDDRGDGKFARQESLDSGFRPPQWIIHKF